MSAELTDDVWVRGLLEVEGALTRAAAGCRLVGAAAARRVSAA